MATHGLATSRANRAALLKLQKELTIGGIAIATSRAKRAALLKLHGTSRHFLGVGLERQAAPIARPY